MSTATTNLEQYRVLHSADGFEARHYDAGIAFVELEENPTTPALLAFWDWKEVDTFLDALGGMPAGSARGFCPSPRWGAGQQHRPHVGSI